MYPNRSLTVTQQPYDRRRYAAQSNHLQPPTASSSEPKVASTSQLGVAQPRTYPPTPDSEWYSFFEQLAFNREEVYLGTARPLASSREDSTEVLRSPPSTRTGAPFYPNQFHAVPPSTHHFSDRVSEVDEDSMARMKQPARKATTATPKAKPTPKMGAKPTTRKPRASAKTVTVKSKETPKPVTPRKRAAPKQAKSEERDVKVAKIESTPDVPTATRSRSLRASAVSPIDLCDSDDDVMKIGCRGLEAAKKTNNPWGDCQSPTRLFSAQTNQNFKLPTQLDSKVEQTVSGLDTQVQRELEHEHRQEMEERISRMVLERQNRDLKHEEEIADLRRQLQVQKERNEAMSEEMNQLRHELEESRRLSEQHETLVQEHNALQEKHRTEGEAHRVVMESLQARHADSLAQIEASTKHVETFQRENRELMKEIGVLKAAEMKSSHRSLLSPEPSISQSTSSSRSTPPPSSSEAKKLDNIRQTYTKVKRRYDSLHSVCVKISACTQSWDLSNFGDFGQQLRLLRQALDEDGEERRTVGGRSQNNRDSRGNSRG